MEKSSFVEKKHQTVTLFRLFCSAIPIRIPDCSFVETDKIILKFVCNLKKPKGDNVIMKNKVEGSINV